MIYELQTRTIDGVDYYCGTVIKRETGTPDWIREQDFDPRIDDFFDEYANLQYVLTDNPDYDPEAGPSRENRPYLIALRPQAPAKERVDARNEARQARSIANAVPYARLVRAVCDLAGGDSTEIDLIRAEIDRIVIEVENTL